MRNTSLLVVLTLAVFEAGCATHPAAQTDNRMFMGQPVITRMVSRNQTVVVTKGPNGPLYAVTDASGKVMLTPRPLEDVAEAQPALYRDIRSAEADASVDSVPSTASRMQDSKTPIMIMRDEAR